MSHVSKGKRCQKGCRRCKHSRSGLAPSSIVDACRSCPVRPSTHLTSSMTFCLRSKVTHIVVIHTKYNLHTTHLTFVPRSVSCVSSFVLTHWPEATAVCQLVSIAPPAIPMSFLCCSSRPHASKSTLDVDTRRARIIPVLHSASQTSVSRPRRYSYDVNEPPPAYSTVPRIARSENEKDTSDSRRRTLQQDHTRAQHVRRSLIESDTSSILSIPSTQVTGLGSEATGTTVAVRRDATGHTEGQRHSLQWSDDGTRPPSYYSTTARPDSLSSEGTGRMLRHPVMREGWLEGILGNS